MPKEAQALAAVAYLQIPQDQLPEQITARDYLSRKVTHVFFLLLKVMRLGEIHLLSYLSLKNNATLRNGRRGKYYSSADNT